MAETVRIAGVQMDIVLGAADANLHTMLDKLREAAAQGAKLVVFPECALGGYCFDSLAEALTMAEPVPGPSVERFAEVCRELGVWAAYGLLERRGDQIHNSCALVGPEGLVGVYRKVHLPYLGVDRFTTAGDEPFKTLPAAGLRVGMLICYDAAFPEASRALALDGADLVLLPTNWPPGAETTARYVINTRALENNVYLLAVNRVGEERGFRFIGQSKICATNGETMAEGTESDELILYADIDPAIARNKHVVRVPNKHEIRRFADRRPELYRPLVERREP